MKKDYDLIIVSRTTPELLGMVQQTIDSCLATRGEKSVNVILVETYTDAQRPENVDKLILYGNEKFNYNRALNLGLGLREGRVQMLANNDLIFRNGWATTGEIMSMNGIMSASLPSGKNKNLVNGHVLGYEGYRVGYHLAGWLIFTLNEIWDKIGELPENYNFWYSDNDYVDTLKEHKIPHYLLTNAVVEHLGGVTIKTLDVNKIKEYTIGERVKYDGKKKRG